MGRGLLTVSIVRRPELVDELVAEGKLNVPVAANYPLDSAAPALRQAQKGGKVLFKVS
jgi:hypothetical protein